MNPVSKKANFLSVVVYLAAGANASSLVELGKCLASQFAHYELVLVHDGDAASLEVDDGPLKRIECASTTVVSMGKRQGLEKAMNAGVDCAVGDFILEIDDLASMDFGFLDRAYALVLQGCDIVFGTASNRSFKGLLFYPLFNRFSGSHYSLTTTVCSLVSRRAVNRVHSMTEFMPYRKAAYASCGLEVASVGLSAKASGRTSDLGLAVDSLALYSDAFYKIAFGFSVLMLILSLAEIVYIVAIYLAGIPIGGWTSTVLMMTLGFFGVFVILTFILKYVSLLLKSQFNRQSYLVERVERL